MWTRSLSKTRFVASPPMRAAALRQRFELVPKRAHLCEAIP